MLKLNDYKNLIDLESKEKSTLVLSIKEKEKIVDNLLKIIKQNFSANIDFSADYDTKRVWLRAILTQLPPFDFGKEFFELQNKFDFCFLFNMRSSYNIQSTYSFTKNCHYRRIAYSL